MSSLMDSPAQNSPLRALPGVYATELVTAPRARPGTAPGLLIEVPHGATRRRHFLATRQRLVGTFPDDLEQFFFVNTDIGSIECARWVARMVTDPGNIPELVLPKRPADRRGPRGVDGVLILRGLVARTFIDLNRVIAGGSRSALEDNLTPGIPGYVTRPEDQRTLRQMHDDYQAAASDAYETVCGNGGMAVILHTYAPRSVELDAVDGGIVSALRHAYEPDVYETWARRPDVDLISETRSGERLAPEPLVRAACESYARSGIEVAENATYRLHESTTGYVRSASYRGRVLCLELNRARLAHSFTPFREMSISDRKARRMAAPLAAALLSALGGATGA